MKQRKDFWSFKPSIGKNLVGNMVSRMMDMTGIKGYFANHSFRATTTVHLYEQNVEKQLIEEITGH